MEITQPVARTAFYCCVIRADDALRPNPVCGDRLASRFVDEATRRDLAGALKFLPPAVSNVARHRIVDDIVRAQLSADPGRRIILIGAGFDTRAYRLQGGRWFELDDPALLAFKEQRLPVVESPNPLTRVPVMFGAVPPSSYLAPLAGDDEALVILEGVSMYLSDAVIEEFASTLARLLPRATLVCDLMSPIFLHVWSRSLRRALADMGAVFGEHHGHPRRHIERAGYRAVRCISIPGRAVEAGSLPIPPLVMATLLRTLRDGYQLWEFRRP